MKSPVQALPPRARKPVMVGNMRGASATVRDEACAREHRLNMSAHHWRRVRAMRVRVGDGHGPLSTAPKTDEQGEFLLSKLSAVPRARQSDLISRWLVRVPVVGADERQDVVARAAAAGKESFKRCSTESLLRA